VRGGDALAGMPRNKLPVVGSSMPVGQHVAGHVCSQRVRPELLEACPARDARLADPGDAVVSTHLVMGAHCDEAGA